MTVHPPAVAPGASVWSAAQVAAIDPARAAAAPLATPADLVRPAPGRWLWDFWPVETLEGAVAPVEGGSLWFALSASALGPPAGRHDRARLRLLWRGAGGQWRDLGDALPDGLSPGSREWSGSAVLAADELLLFFTAAGRRGEPSVTFEQRLFQTRARLEAGPRLTGWTTPVQSVASDGDLYHPADQAEGEIGRVKAFRDPFFFRDPASGATYLLFTASLGRSASAFNGAIGIARAGDASLERWDLLSPLVSADGLNNELERPHARVLGGRYRLYWSTQASVFAPGGPMGPTGLYGLSAPALAGPWKPDTPGALILANPPGEPDQAYSWLVLDGGAVVSFLDRPSWAGGFAGAPLMGRLPSP